MTQINDALGRLFAAMRDVAELDEGALISILDAFFQDHRRQLPELFDGAETDAMWWASIAAPIDMEAALNACAIYLPVTPMHVSARKRVMAASFTWLSDADRARFLAWASRQPAQTDQEAAA